MIFIDQINLRHMPHKSGAFGVVIKYDSGKAIKIFYKKQTKPDDLIKDTHASEVAAYKIAASNQVLSEITPKFYGCARVGEVMDKVGVNIPSQFELEMAYGMEWVDGDFIKLNTCSQETEKYISNVFKMAGIEYVLDASVIMEGGLVKCVIDFSTHWIEGYH